jgi:hypothetical protein
VQVVLELLLQVPRQVAAAAVAVADKIPLHRSFTVVAELDYLVWAVVVLVAQSTPAEQDPVVVVVPAD